MQGGLNSLIFATKKYTTGGNSEELQYLRLPPLLSWKYFNTNKFSVQ